MQITKEFQVRYTTPRGSSCSWRDLPLPARDTDDLAAKVKSGEATEIMRSLVETEISGTTALAIRTLSYEFVSYDVGILKVKIEYLLWDIQMDRPHGCIDQSATFSFMD
jgi:hypothetical protein